MLKKIERTMKFPGIKLQSPLLGFNPNPQDSERKRNRVVTLKDDQILEIRYGFFNAMVSLFEYYE